MEAHIIGQWIDQLNDEQFEVRELARANLRDTKEDSVAALIATMCALNGRSSWESAMVLADLAHEAAFTPFQEMLIAAHPLVSPIAAGALAAYGSRGVDSLIAALPRVGFMTQLAIIKSLNSIGDARAVRPLVDLLHRTDSPVIRYTIIQCLPTFRDLSTIGAICAFADDDDQHVRDRVRTAMAAFAPLIASTRTETRQFRRPPALDTAVGA